MQFINLSVYLFSTVKPFCNVFFANGQWVKKKHHSSVVYYPILLVPVLSSISILGSLAQVQFSHNRENACRQKNKTKTGFTVHSIYEICLKIKPSIEYIIHVDWDFKPNLVEPRIFTNDN